ncbi:MAG: MSHA biogenesis protein MshO [Candidatus Pseudothioglobus sp.]|jgi:MSHA biogenesis protein MshO
MFFGPHKHRSRAMGVGNNGFTLVELVVVIVLMSLVSLAGVEMIRYSTDGFLAMSNRQALGSASRIAVERISRELRSALPNSIRVNVAGNCLEFIPIRAAGTYLNLPVEAAAISFRSAAMNPGQETESGRVVVYPLSPNNVYNAAGGVMSDLATLSAADASNIVTVTMASSFQFANHSPLERFFLVDAPVSYCLDGELLFRYKNYGLQATQNSVAGLPTALPSRALLVDGVDISPAPFQYETATLVRNAIVTVDLQFIEAGETQRLVSEVQLRNVP